MKADMEQVLIDADNYAPEDAMERAYQKRISDAEQLAMWTEHYNGDAEKAAKQMTIDEMCDAGKITAADWVHEMKTIDPEGRWKHQN